MNLIAKTLFALAALAVVMGLALFVPAGTAAYWQGWAFLAVFIGAGLAGSLYLARRDPALLQRRLRGGPTAERRPVQRLVMAIASLGFASLLVIPALDFRLGWSHLPAWVAAGGDALVALGFVLIFRVYRVNSFTSATIEVAAGQTVVTTGPYAVVRHPMYAGSLLYVVGIPLALGSCWGLAGAAIMIPALVWRLFDEERMLAADLPGYAAYRAKVRWRLIPGLF